MKNYKTINGIRFEIVPEIKASIWNTYSDIYDAYKTPSAVKASIWNEWKIWEYTTKSARV